MLSNKKKIKKRRKRYKPGYSRVDITSLKSPTSYDITAYFWLATLTRKYIYIYIYDALLI